MLLVWFAVDLALGSINGSADGAEIAHRFCARIVSALGIEWRASGTALYAGAVVGNHLSYLDILLFAATRPFIMVAKSEVSGWPLIGWIARQVGTVFVVRGGGPSTYSEVNRAMAKAFCSGNPVLFFPEGTTTDGTNILPFRRGLLHSVLNEQVPLQAAAICYSSEDACWWGDALLLPHLFRLVGMQGLEAAIHFGEVVPDRCDRFELAESARCHVAQIHADLACGKAELVETLENLFDRPVESVGSFDGYGGVLR